MPNRSLADMELLKLGLVLLVIVMALRRKVPVGITMICAGGVTALLFGVSFEEVVGAYSSMASSTRFIALTAVLMLVTLLGTLLRELGLLEKLLAAAGELNGGKRAAAMTLPALIGMMPMPGGAGLSAPLVGGVLAEEPVSPERKAVVNYWFRHFMEFTWPAYPGIVLTEAITHLPIRLVALLQLPLAIAMVGIGYIFFARTISAESGRAGQLALTLAKLAAAIWPVLAAMTLYGLTGLDLSICLLVVVVVVCVIYRPPPPALWKAVKTGLSPDLIFFVVGVLSFQRILELSGAIAAIPATASMLHLPDELVICLVCFLVGFLTSMSAAVVGLGYTVLSAYLLVPVVDPARIILAYYSGYLGMMLAPSHLCLVLSHRHFGGDLLGIYRQLGIPLVLLSIFCIVLVASPWPAWLVSVFK